MKKLIICLVILCGSLSASATTINEVFSIFIKAKGANFTHLEATQIEAAKQNKMLKQFNVDAFIDQIETVQILNLQECTYKVKDAFNKISVSDDHEYTTLLTTNDEKALQIIVKKTDNVISEYIIVSRSSPMIIKIKRADNAIANNNLANL